MKPFSVIAIIKESKVLFLFAVLSVITHTSIFLINPTFSFTISDKWEGSKGRFLVVELRKEEGKASERAKSPGVQEFRDSGVQKKNEGAGIGRSKKVASAAEKEKNNLQVIKKESHPRSKSISKPAVSPPTHREAADIAQAKVQEKKIEGLSAGSIEDHKELGQPSESDLSSPERAMISSDKSGIREEIKAVSAPPSVEPEERSEVGPIEQEVAQESEAIVPVEKAADQPAIANVTEVVEKSEVIQASAHDEIKDNPIDEGKETERKEEVSVAEPRTSNIDLTVPEKSEIEVKEPGKKEEGQSDVMVSEGSPAEKVEDVKEADTEKGEQPVVTDSIQPETPEIEHPQEVKITEKEPERVVEQIVEPPIKKKKRTIPFHKMLEPEKEATIGIPVGRPVVKITAPSRKKVGSKVQGISGTAQGNGVLRVILSINGDNTTIPVQNGRFLWDSVLREGKTTILATVWDMEGYSATDSITVEVLSPKNSFELSIDEPAGGEVESPVAMVRGRVEDATVDTVRLIVNGEFIETPVEDGYFEKTVFLKERENTLEAEAINPAGLAARSGVLKVEVKNPMIPDILFHLLCDDHDMESHPKVTLRERSQLDDEKGAVSDVDAVEMMSANEGYWEKVFAVEEARDGAYTLKVSGGRGTDCKLVVTLNSSKRKVRVFEKRLLEGEEWAVGRFLFPEGVFWDEDEWFSGRIEDKDSITKYRSPEGITWKELKIE